MRALNIATTGMLAQQLNVAVISNNVANMGTTGFKRRRTEFQDLLYQNYRRVGSPSSDAGTLVPAGVHLGVGVRPAGNARITSQGALTVTENVLDTAINGRGFYRINLPDGGTAYTRNGAFQLNSSGQIVTNDGYLIEGPGTIPQDAVDVIINPSGQVWVKLDGAFEPQNVGRISLFNFVNEPGLEAIGDNLFLASNASGQAIEGTAGSPSFGSVIQGTIEASNVNIVTEITNLISAQRAYEMNSKLIQAADQMMQTASTLR